MIQDLESERRLLSCMAIDAPQAHAIATDAGITADSFADFRNRIIWQTGCAMIANGDDVNAGSLAARLAASGTLDRVGVAHLMECTGSEPTTANAPMYVRQVRSAEVRRMAHAEALALAKACEQPSDEPCTVIDAHTSRLLSVSAGFSGKTEQTWAQVVGEAETGLESILSGKDEAGAVHWPWPTMDAVFAPMRKGQLIIFAARPSVGKSSIARPVAMSAAAHGCPVYFCTLEVDPVRVPLQMASTISGVGLREARGVHRFEQDKLRQALRELKGLGITISRRDRTIARICGRARALHAQGKLGMLIVDHGLLVDDVAKAKQVEQMAAISQLTKALKVLAGDLGIVCVLLWQLNRASANDDNREPNLADLRGSGSLEEDADKVIFIHRPNESPCDHQQQHPSQSVDDRPIFHQNIIQAKGRDDGTGLVTMAFHRSTATFRLLDRR